MGSTIYFENTASLGATAPAYAAATTNPFGIRYFGVLAYASPDFGDVDGDLDLFIGITQGNIIYFKNTAALGASAPAYATATTNPFGITDVGSNASPVFADTDADGDLDLFIGNRDGNTIYFKNTASLGATAPAYATATTNPFRIIDIGSNASPVLADTDADGDLDLFIGNDQGSTFFFLNTASTPVIPLASSSANGRYSTGGLITLTLQFSEAVFVTGTPRLQLETGATDQFATYSSGSGTTTLSFTYTVQAGDSSADLDQLAANALDLDGGTIKDAAGNNAVLSLASPGSAGSLSANAALIINRATVTALGSSSANGSYRVGSLLTLTVQFSDPVTVTTSGGTPMLGLETGALDRYATYTSGSGTGTLSFSYTVRAGDRSTDLDQLSAHALVLNGGTIQDAAGSDAILALPAPGATGSLGANGTLGLDTQVPTGSLISSSAPAYGAATINPYGITSLGAGAYANPTFADVDGDGDLDLFVGNQDGNILYFNNIATSAVSVPAYATATTNPFGITDIGSWASPVLADVDGDGDLDLFLGTNNGNIVYFNNTAALAATTPTYAAASTNPFEITSLGANAYASPVFGDVDGDGDLDLFIGNAAGNTVYFKNTATLGARNPAYAAATTNPFGITSLDVNIPGVGTYAKPALFDTDGDGDLDLFIGTNNGNIVYFNNTAALGVSAPAYAAAASNPFGINSLGNGTFASPAFADGDGDGDLDLFIGNSAGNTIYFSNTAAAPVIPATYTTANGSYPSGALITLTLQFSEAVLVTTTGGTPRLQLETGAIDRYATYTSGSGTTTLSFTYTVQAGDTSSDLDFTSTIALDPNGGTIRDAAGNDAILTLAAPGAAGSLGANAALIIDVVAPTVSISSNLSTLKATETATITFSFSEDPGSSFYWDGTSGDLAVSGGTLSSLSGSGLTRTATFTPTANNNAGTASISVTAGSYSDSAGNNGAAGTTPALTFDTLAPSLTSTISLSNSALTIGDTANVTVSFSEAVTAFDLNDITSDNGLLSNLSTADNGHTWTATFTPTANTTDASNLIGLNLTTITDLAGNAGSGSADSGNYTIDTQRPSLSNPSGLTTTTANGSYAVGSTITILVPFLEVVTVNTSSGTPTLLLETGATDRTATYSSGSGTNTLAFSYTVQTGDTSADLDYTSTIALDPNGGTIQDAAGNDAILSLSTPGEAGSLGANAALVIDTSNSQDGLDNDGALDSYESNKDANSDGTYDNYQANVATFITSDGTSSIAIRDQIIAEETDPDTGGTPCQPIRCFTLTMPPLIRRRAVAYS